MSIKVRNGRESMEQHEPTTSTTSADVAAMNGVESMTATMTKESDDSSHEGQSTTDPNLHPTTAAGEAAATLKTSATVTTAAASEKASDSDSSPSTSSSSTKTTIKVPGSSDSSSHQNQMKMKKKKKKKQPKSGSNSASRTVTSTIEQSIVWQTAVRNAATPYLPPPLVRAIAAIDPPLQPYVGPEPTITLLSTCLVAYVVWSILRWLMKVIVSSSSTGRALADDDDDALLSSSSSSRVIRGGSAGESRPYDATVLLCGPVGAGKTRLFYQLCYGPSNMPTLMSIKANVGLSSSTMQQPHQEQFKQDTMAGPSSSTTAPVIRYMDWPGHASLNEPAIVAIVKKQPRLIVVVDSTQPVAPGADVLFDLLQLAHEMQLKKNLLRKKKKKKQQSSAAGDNNDRDHDDGPALQIFVACHKKDFPKAKNWRRIKIQIRTELERLIQIRSITTKAAAAAAAATSGIDLTTTIDTATTTTTTMMSQQQQQQQQQQLWWPAGVPLDLDQLSFAQLHFASTSCEGNMVSTELARFCQTGVLPKAVEESQTIIEK